MLHAASNSHFRKHSAVYTCAVCGKKTRETGSGESSTDLCLACYNEALLENEHMDYGHPTPVPGCPYCPKTEKK